ncbi:tetratricopeptide repeat protein [bacterium]|nr:tetratricopeptide repeat protein [bacterium]
MMLLKFCKGFPLFFVILSLLTLSACSSRSITSYVKEADALMAADKKQEAIILYQKAIKDNPDEPVLYINQAAILRDTKKYPLALKNYNILLNLNPSIIWPYTGMAQVFLAQKKYAHAQDILTQAQHYFPTHGAIDFYQGRLAYELKMGDQALEKFNRALDHQYPHLYKVYYYRGRTFQDLLTNKERAKLDYESCLLSNPTNKEVIEDVNKRLSLLDDTLYDF